MKREAELQRIVRAVRELTAAEQAALERVSSHRAEVASHARHRDSLIAACACCGAAPVGGVSGRPTHRRPPPLRPPPVRNPFPAPPHPHAIGGWYCQAAERIRELKRLRARMYERALASAPPTAAVRRLRQRQAFAQEQLRLAQWQLRVLEVVRREAGMAAAEYSTAEARGGEARTTAHRQTGREAETQVAERCLCARAYACAPAQRHHPWSCRARRRSCGRRRC